MKIKNIVAFLGSIICALLLIIFKTAPSGSLWAGYRIVYADVSTESSVVLKELENAGCKNVISSVNQKLPIFVSETSPEISLMKSSFNEQNYIAKRLLYFFDKGKQYNLYYVLEKDSSLAEKAILQLQESGIPSGIDNNVSYPVVLPIVVLAFAFFLLYLSRKKAVFALGSFFPILLSFCSPFYSLASSLMLLLYAIYLSCLFWKRKNAFNYILKNFVIVLFFASSVFIAFFTSPKSALLFCICVLGVLCVLYSKNVIDELFDKKYTFKPVLIRSAKSIKTFTNFSKSELLSCSAGIFLLLFFSFFSTGNLSIKSKKMIFPSAHSNGITDTLPVLEDYVSWYYETLSSPYKRLEPDSKKNKSTSISFPRYKSTENGIVLYNESYSFDDSFFEKTVARIDELPYPALEKMIKAQGQNIKPGYSSNTAQKNTIFHTILIIFALVVPVLVLLRSKNI